MTLPEVEERFNKSIAALKSLEQILKGLDASYDVHIARLSSLKHLADSCSDLKRYEVEAIRSAQIAAQVAQQSAAREAAAREAAAKAQEVASSQAPAPVVAIAPVETETKRTRKKAE
jgi:peptidoglycan hydrolase CwlO-like protein